MWCLFLKLNGAQRQPEKQHLEQISRKQELSHVCLEGIKATAQRELYMSCIKQNLSPQPWLESALGNSFCKTCESLVIAAL